MLPAHIYLLIIVISLHSHPFSYLWHSLSDLVFLISSNISFFRWSKFTPVEKLVVFNHYVGSAMAHYGNKNFWSVFWIFMDYISPTRSPPNLRGPIHSEHMNSRILCCMNLKSLRYFSMVGSSFCTSQKIFDSGCGDGLWLSSGWFWSWVQSWTTPVKKRIR